MGTSEWTTGVTTAAEMVVAEQEYETWVQDRRIEALHAARHALVKTSIGGSEAADAVDLVNVARWIMTGVIWPASTEPDGVAYVRGRGAVPFYDTELPGPPYPDEGRDGPSYDNAAGDEGR